MTLLSATLTQGTVRKGIKYEELPDYKVNLRTNTAQEATRILICRWVDRQQLISSMLPLNVIGPAIGNVTISRFNNPAVTREQRLTFNRLDPEPHPVYPWLYAVEGEELGGLGIINKDPSTGRLSFQEGTGAADSGYGKVSITYRPIPYTLTQIGVNNGAINASAGDSGSGIYETCRYVSVKTRGSIKSLPIPGTVFRFYTPPYDLIPDASTIQCPIVHMAYTWYQVPKVPNTAMDFMGCVNAYKFDITPRPMPFNMSIFPIGTVLYNYNEISDFYPLADGTLVVDVTYHMSYNPNGWNRFFRPTLGGTFVPGYRGTPTVNPGSWAFGSNGVGVYTPNTLVNGTGQTGPPVVDPTFRWPPGYNIYDYVDLNLLFTILDPSTVA